jgi:hypothetical protein
VYKITKTKKEGNGVPSKNTRDLASKVLDDRTRAWMKCP